MSQPFIILQLLVAMVLVSSEDRTKIEDLIVSNSPEVTRADLPLLTVAFFGDNLGNTSTLKGSPSGYIATLGETPRPQWHIATLGETPRPHWLTNHVVRYA